jgi:hypothetical protein
MYQNVMEELSLNNAGEPSAVNFDESYSSVNPLQ